MCIISLFHIMFFRNCFTMTSILNALSISLLPIKIGSTLCMLTGGGNIKLYSIAKLSRKKVNDLEEVF